MVGCARSYGVEHLADTLGVSAISLSEAMSGGTATWLPALSRARTDLGATQVIPGCWERGMIVPSRILGRAVSAACASRSMIRAPWYDDPPGWPPDQWSAGAEPGRG